MDIVVFADDLSGAAETAAVFLGRDPAPILELDATQGIRDGVTVVDLDSRTMPAVEAVRVLRTALDAVAPTRTVMHKIDSLLRGHVGASVDVLASRGPVIVAAGLPTLGRQVRGGVLYVDGRPLHRTGMWRLEVGPPPRAITDLIGSPAKLCISQEDIVSALQAGLVAVCDVTDDAELDAIVGTAQTIAGVQLVGTSALAAAIARTQPEVQRDVAHRALIETASAVLTVVGTAAPNAAAQVATLIDQGAAHVVLDAEQLLAGATDGGSAARIVDTERAVVAVITGKVPLAQQHALATALGAFVAEVDRRSACRPDLVLTGGETARAVIDALGVSALRPVAVVHHGAVICSSPDGRRIATRPGSFGDRNSLADIAAHLATTSDLASVDNPVRRTTP